MKTIKQHIMGKIYLAKDKNGRLYKYTCEDDAPVTEIFDKGEEIESKYFPEVTYENSPFLLREVTEYLLPSYWACALINDDYNGLTDDEIEEIRNFLKDANGHPVDVKWETEGFYHHNDAGTLPGDCVTYVFFKDY